MTPKTPTDIARWAEARAIANGDTQKPLSRIQRAQIIVAAKRPGMTVPQLASEFARADHEIVAILREASDTRDVARQLIRSSAAELADRMVAEADPVTVLDILERVDRVDNVRLRILSDDEVSRVLEACPPDLRLVARTTLECLMRLSEVLGLRLADIGPSYATIVRSKNGQSRRVPLTPELRDALILRSQGHGYVFGFGKDDTPATAAACSVAYARLIKPLSLAGVSHHTFRHTGASNMLRDGASARAVQLIGGWTTLRMVERYCHVTDEELHKAVGLASKHAPGTHAGTATPIYQTGRATTDAKTA